MISVEFRMQTLGVGGKEARREISERHPATPPSVSEKRYESLAW